MNKFSTPTSLVSVLLSSVCATLMWCAPAHAQVKNTQEAAGQEALKNRIDDLLQKSTKQAQDMQADAAAGVDKALATGDASSLPKPDNNEATTSKSDTPPPAPSGDKGAEVLGMKSPDEIAAEAYNDTVPQPPAGSNDPTATPSNAADANRSVAAQYDSSNPPPLPPLPSALGATSGVPMPLANAPDASALPPVVDANGLATANPSAPLPALAFDNLDDDEKKTKKKKKKHKKVENYDYHRQELPPTISKAVYNLDNRHLPPAIYWQSLEMDMFYAAREGDMNAMRALVAKGVSVNLHNQLGEPLITLAARYGRSDVVHWLIVHGARVNDVSAAGKAPLHVAAERGDAKMVKVLLDGGADPNMPDDRGVYPLAAAAGRGMSDASAVLREYGAM